MTRYRVVVADAVLARINDWLPTEGFRLITTEKSQIPQTTICVFEDDDAPVHLEGKLVVPTFREDDDGTRTVVNRELVQ